YVLGDTARHPADHYPVETWRPRQPVGAMSILPLVSGPKTPTAVFVASSAAWTERSRARKSVPNTAGSRLSHVDVLAFVEASRWAGGSVARGVLADPLPGGRGAHRGPDAPWEPGAELVL